MTILSPRSFVERAPKKSQPTALVLATLQVKAGQVPFGFPINEDNIDLEAVFTMYMCV